MGFEMVGNRSKWRISLAHYMNEPGNDYIEIEKYAYDEENKLALGEEWYYEISVPSFIKVSKLEVKAVVGKQEILIPYQFGQERLNNIISLIERANTPEELQKTILFIKSDLDDGDLIEMANGVIGKVSWDHSESIAIKYFLIKKDGKVGKQLRLLYGSTNYTVIQ